MLKIILRNGGKVITIFCLIAAAGYAQMAKNAPGYSSNKVWQLPFASTGNTISISVLNSSAVEAKNVSVTFNNPPSWFQLKSDAVLLKSIPALSSKDAQFEFSIDKNAPTGKDTTLTATVSIPNGQKWTREFRISVQVPKDYKLYNNFPNPFNPTTKIAFELPRTSHVTMVVYDITGSEVARIANGEYPAGYSEVTWNGLNDNGEHVSSGIYFYRISAGSWSKVMKMMMLK